MKLKNKIIVSLFAVGVILFCIIQFGVNPYYEKKRKVYAENQFDATTHDLNSILKYKSKYMGDAPNLAGLFRNLPLSSSEMKFQIIPEELTFKVIFTDSVVKAGKNNVSKRPYASLGLQDELDKAYVSDVHKSLIYNSIAAFALIDNLEKIVYNFSDAIYTVARKDMADFLHTEPVLLLDDGKWKTEVQDKLKDSEFVDRCMQQVFSQSLS